MQTSPIILASSSPRRKDLLNMINLKFETIPSQIHEDFSIDLAAENFVMHYAEKKAQDISNQYKNHLVIGADTVVVLNRKILGKPADKEESFSMLTSLSGKTHSVFTGVSLQHEDANIHDTFFAKTDVTFSTLSNNDISYYIDNYAPLDKAGSYGIQDWFAVCVKKIDGCFYNVMGFPLSTFYERYKKLKPTVIIKPVNRII